MRFSFKKKYCKKNIHNFWLSNLYSSCCIKLELATFLCTDRAVTHFRCALIRAFMGLHFSQICHIRDVLDSLPYFEQRLPIDIIMCILHLALYVYDGTMRPSLVSKYFMFAISLSDKRGGNVIQFLSVHIKLRKTNQRSD